MVFLRVHLAYFCLFHLLMMFLVRSIFVVLQIHADDLQIYHSSSVADLQRCYDEVNADLKQIYD
jgi:hypothetical protein